MRLLVTRPFNTVVIVNSNPRRFAAVEGQTFDLDDETAAALLRDVSACLTPVVEAAQVFAAIRDADVLAEAESIADPPTVEIVEVPEEIVAPPKVARTRQVAKRPGPRPTAKKVKR